jgi:IS5 family transposase
LEYQRLDRASFPRFTGLEHAGRVPDAKTIWVWRERLKTQDLIGDISEAVGRQLTSAGFIARGGQIIDATVISAPIQRNTSEEIPQFWAG